MSKEQIIDEAYENYRKTILTEFFENTKELRKWATVEGPGGYNKEEFISKCKTDSEFSKKWGLKIEEREVLAQIDQTNPILKGSTALYPHKLITITYNGTKIESYE